MLTAKVYIQLFQSLPTSFFFSFTLVPSSTIDVVHEVELNPKYKQRKVLAVKQNRDHGQKLHIYGWVSIYHILLSEILNGEFVKAWKALFRTDNRTQIRTRRLLFQLGDVLRSLFLFFYTHFSQSIKLFLKHMSLYFYCQQ